MEIEEVTLVVPCYNTARTLPAVLNAIHSLDPSPKRVLCVDDGSTDETAEILELDEKVDLIKHDENRGIGATLNTALNATNTDWFAKVDADIVVPPTWLERIWEAREESGAALVQGRFIERIVTPADRWRAKYPSPNFPLQPRWNKPLNGGTMLASTDALRDVGGWDIRYRRAFDDIDLMKRLIRNNYDVYYSPTVRSTHIRRDTWKEVLRTDWAYSNNPIYGGEPDDLLDVVSRLPHHFYNLIGSVRDDLVQRDFDLVWISTLRFPYHVLWDVNHVLTADAAY